MPVHVGAKPEKCPNPDCGLAEGFTFKSTQFIYDQRSQMGTTDINQSARARVTTWKCDACESLIEIWADL